MKECLQLNQISEHAFPEEVFQQIDKTNFGKIPRTEFQYFATSHMSLDCDTVSYIYDLVASSADGLALADFVRIFRNLEHGFEFLPL